MPTSAACKGDKGKEKKKKQQRYGAETGTERAARLKIISIITFLKKYRK